MLPDLGKSMAKVQQSAGKEHDQSMVTARRPRGVCWGGGPALLSLLSPRGIPSWAKPAAYSVRSGPRHEPWK